MQTVEIATAMHMVQTNTVNRAAIECYDGRRWCIVLRGKQDYVLRSERQNPRPFVGVETAIKVVHSMGLRSAEIDFKRWNPDQKTI
jgi:hypothetical protein